jgi:arylsulfatase A-like enzyme
MHIILAPSNKKTPPIAALAAFTVFVSLILITCTSGGETQPNVVLVMTDDQGYGDIGAHGSPYVKTPALDGLYAGSVRLTDFHVDPCCSPTRAALLTGQYSSRTGVWHTIGGRSLLRRGKVTLADAFNGGGYRTAIFGKWHLGDNYPFRPQDRGFQETLVHKSGSVGNRWDYWGNDYNDDTYYRNGRPEEFEGYCNTVWFDEAIEFLRANRDRPFFCFLSTNVPHAPLTVDASYVEPYRTQVSDQLARYYGMITKFDEDMARLLRALDELGLAENTILIFMTDNGPCPWYGGIKIDEDGFVEEGYSAGMRGGKIWGYENAHRVPFFIRWPARGIGGGRDILQLLGHIDLFPTLLEMCGLEKPEHAGFDGKSFWPLLVDPQSAWEERTLFVHNQRVDFPVKYKDYQVLTERWRLVRRASDELYDIQADPGQRNDIAAQHPEVVEDLRQKYEAWWADVSQDFDVYDQTVIGSDYENPTTLYSHDSHSSERGGVWVIEAAREGEYAFRLFRWPEEAQKPIGENRAGEQVFPVKRANLVAGNLRESCPVTPDATSAELVIHLQAGTICLEAWFEADSAGQKIGADFVHVERLGPADPDSAKSYRASDPDTILKSGYTK